MLRTARLAYRTLGGLFVAGTVAQFFLAGLGVFGAASFGAHATLGTILGIVSLILLLLAGVLVFTHEQPARYRRFGRPGSGPDGGAGRLRKAVGFLARRAHGVLHSGVLGPHLRLIAAR
jgi:Family of unknown function (DUF6220)